MYSHTYVHVITINEKRSHEFGGKGAYVGGLVRKKGKGEIISLYYNLKDKNIFKGHGLEVELSRGEKVFISSHIPGHSPSQREAGRNSKRART